MENTITAMIDIGFTQEEARKQIEDLSNVLTALVTKRIFEENPELERTEEGLKMVIESRYAGGKYLKLFQEIAGHEVAEYFEAITAGLTPIKRDKFYQTIALDIPR